MSVYYDGELMGETNSKKSGLTISFGSGRMAIGRRYFDSDEKYATMEIDELTLWNN